MSGIQDLAHSPSRQFSPAKLFIERVQAFWTAIWRCWRLVFDWTVVLYIALPLGFISVGMYRDFMRDPTIAPAIPLYVPLAIMAVLQLAGKYRIFSEPGDGLLLDRLTSWKRVFLRFGLIYGVAARFLKAAAIIGVLSPLLLSQYGLSGNALLGLAIYYAAAGSCWMMAHDRLALRWQGLRRTLALLVCGAVYTAAVAGAAVKGAEHAPALILLGALGLGAAWLLLSFRQRRKGTLMHEIAVENECYVSLVGWILRDTMEKKSVPRQRRPVLFVRSQPLIRHRNVESDRLADSWVKSLLRRSDLWRPLLTLLWAGMAAILLTPVALSLIVLLLLPILTLASLQLQWRQWLDEPYLALFDWKEEVLNQASLKAKSRVALPLVTIWGTAAGIKAGLAFGGFGWLAVAIVPLCGYFWLRVVKDFMSSLFTRRKRE